MRDNGRFKFIGHCRITDRVTGELIMEKRNAVHPQNLGRAIGRSLARDSNGPVFKMAFGNGGTFFNSSQTLIFRSPNTIGSATLYNETWEVQVDDQDPSTPATNSVVSVAAPSPSISTIVTVIAQLNSNEPPGQEVADNITTDPEGIFVFDEIGLKTEDDLLLSHLIFSPIEKTANRAFLITYTLTISAS